MTVPASLAIQAVEDTGDLSVLSAVSSPEALRQLPVDQLPRLATAIRTLLVDTVLKMGGHLGPNLGVVELTIALHRVFDSPRDTLLFDTGHQTYVHKILTGRGPLFAQALRQGGGLSGYPNRGESRHDVIENSHASTALGYADGLAKARALQGAQDRAVVAIVGDGALTGGMAFEALNNIGSAPQRPIIIVLNDNGHSYAATAGALADHLRHLRTGGRASGGEPVLPTVFEHLGLVYIGPVDGHDVTALESAFRRARVLRRPVIVHVITVKGQGYPPACADPERMHTTGRLRSSAAQPAPRSWTEVFADALVDIGQHRADVVAITAAMPGPTGLARFAQRFPQRCFDVGIAEQHAVASAAGLAVGGLHPVVAVYSTFLNRAFDQVLLDVALHRLPVTFVLDRAGITGPDGPSHHGMWDLTLLSAVPGLRVAAPRDATGLRELVAEAVGDGSGPTAVRFPKASVGPDVSALERLHGVDVLYRAAHRDVLLVSVGALAGDCVEAARRLDQHDIGVTVIDPRWVLPVSDFVIGACLRHRMVAVVEDNTAAGGVAAAMRRALTEAGTRIPVRGIALPHRFLGHGERAAILLESGLTAPGIAESVLSAYGELVHEQEGHHACPSL